ncbi:MAG TPA: SEC-C metal-binding domain-containing protein, partial [Arthrobacter sp.]|nr:SEC-C metal-binding domain-containing protein [Arthrobacter sp.]
MTPIAAGPPGADAQPARPPFRGNCPCLSGEQYGECCGRFHDGLAEA